jgi:hypothetical protein
VEEHLLLGDGALVLLRSGKTGPIAAIGQDLAQY